MENYTTYKPEWAPSDAGKEFACQVMSGIDEVGHPSEPGPARFVRKQYTVDDYVEGVLRGDRIPQKLLRLRRHHRLLRLREA